MEDSQAKFYMVRAMGQSQDELDVFTSNSVVAIGWSRVKFSDMDMQSVRSEVEKHYFSERPIDRRFVGKQLARITRFKQISEGDKILVPYGSYVLLAEATAEQRFDVQAADRYDLGNQRVVKFRKVAGEIIKIPRRELSEALQRRLIVRGSIVSDLNSFGGEITRLFNSIDDQSEIGWKSHFVEKETRARGRLTQLLLNNIRSGQTNLRTSGLGLELLIKELLELDGYEARILSKRAFPGDADADIEAIREERFIGETRLLVQVKHHWGNSDDWGRRQLEEIARLCPEYNEHDKVLITSAEAPPSLKEDCQKAGIYLMTGGELADWIVSCMPQLSHETRQKLGILSVNRLLSEED